MSREVLSGLIPGTQYAIQVRSTNTEGVSEWSRRVIFTTMNDEVLPSLPTNVTWVVSGSGFHAEWDSVVANVNGDTIPVTRYEVELVSSGITKIVSVPQATGVKTTFDLSFEQNLALFGTARANITIRVRAVDNKELKSGWSNAVAANNAVPTAPSSITGTPAVDSIYLKWAASNDADVVGYRLHTGNTAGFTPTEANRIFSGNATEFTYATTTYAQQFFKVVAVDVFGQTSAAATSSGVTPNSPYSVDTTPPAVPSNLAATITNNANGIGARAALTWNNPADSDLGSVEIQYKRNADSVWSSVRYSKDTTSATLELPYAYTAYDFRIRAIDWTNNYSTWSSTLAKPAVANTAPANVSGLTGTRTRDSATLTWTAVADADLARYEVTLSKSSTFASGNLTYNAGTNQLTISGLDAGTTYYTRVRAVDTGGLTSAAWSSTYSFTTLAYNAGTSDGVAPTTSPTPSIVSGLGYLSVTWTPITNNDQVTYEVHLSTTSGFTPASGTKINEVYDNGVIIRSTAAGAALVYGTTYYVKLVAKDRDGAAPAGNQASGTPQKALVGDITLSPSDIGAPTTTQLNTVDGKIDNAINVTIPQINTNVSNAQTAADNAGNAAGNAQIAANNAKLEADKANTAALQAAGIANGKGKVWSQNDAPLAGYTYKWSGSPNASTSMKAFNGVDIEADRNRHPNPGARSVTGWSSWTGNSGNVSATSIEPAAWSVSGSAYRRTWTTVTSPTTGDFGVVVAGAINDEVYTIVWDVVVGRTGIVLNSPNIYNANSGTWTTIAKSTTDATTMTAGVPQRFWITFTKTSGALADIRAISTFNKQAGDWLEASNAYLYAGPYDPNKTFFYGDTPDDRANDLWINTNGGQNSPNRWINGTWQVVTDKVATDAAATAASAASTASQALADANTANNNATKAQTTADGKNSIYHSTSAPGNAPNIAGDTWFVRNTSANLITAQYEGLGGTSWRQVTLDNAVIANLNVGKLVSGTIDTAEIVIANSGVIRSANYSSGSAGWRIGPSGIEIYNGTILISAVSNLQSSLNSKATPADVQNAQNTAVNTDWMTLNTNFALWTSGLPNGWPTLVGTSPVQETALARTSPFAVRFNTSGTTNAYISSPAAQNLFQFVSDYITVEIDVMLVSGTFAGSAVLIDWNGQSGSRTPIHFHTEIPSPTLNKWYRVTKVIKKPTGLASVTGYAAFLMGNWSSAAGGATTKQIIFDRFAARPATAEEITAYEAPGNLSTRATQLETYANNAASNAQTGAINSIKTLWGHPSNTTLINGGNIFTNSIYAKSIALSDFNNYAPGGGFDVSTDIEQWSVANTTGMSIDTTTSNNSVASLKVVGGTGRSLYSSIAVKSGDVIRLQADVLTTTDYNGTNSNGKLRIGDAIGGGILSATTWPNTQTWQSIDRTFVVPTGVSRLSLGLIFDHTAGTIWLDNVVFRKMEAAQLIVDGEIVSRHMAANSITAENGALANLAVTTAKIADLAVTDAKINTLTVSKVTAGSFTGGEFVIAPSGILRTANSAVIITDTGITITSAGAVDAGALQSSTTISATGLSLTGNITLNSGTGYIRGGGYTGTDATTNPSGTGWFIGQGGLHIDNGIIDASAIRAGNIGGPAGTISVINVTAGTSFVFNGGYLKSNTYTGTAYSATAGAGWYLGNDGLRIAGGSVSASAITAGTISGTNTITLSGANARIVGTGFTLSGSGLTVTSGTIAAAAITITTAFADSITATTTTIDGGKIKTGSIQSNTSLSTGQPSWIIGLDGSAKFSNMQVLGNTVLGNSTTDSASMISSSNYVAGTSGWRIVANGAAELNDVTVRGNIQGNANSVISGGIFQTGSGNASVVRISATDGFETFKADGNRGIHIPLTGQFASALVINSGGLHVNGTANFINSGGQLIALQNPASQDGQYTVLTGGELRTGTWVGSASFPNNMTYPEIKTTPTTLVFASAPGVEARMQLLAANQTFYINAPQAIRQEAFGGRIYMSGSTDFESHALGGNWLSTATGTFTGRSAGAAIIESTGGNTAIRANGSAYLESTGGGSGGVFLNTAGTGGIAGTTTNGVISFNAQGVDNGYFQVQARRNISFTLATTNSSLFFNNLPFGTGQNLVIATNGLVAKLSSSLRYKRDIVKLDSTPNDSIFDIELVKYRYKDEVNGWAQEEKGYEIEPRHHLGVIAEQVDELGLTDLVMYDNEGRPDGFNYQLVGLSLLPHVKKVVNTVKEQTVKIEDLEARLARLENLLA